MVEQQFHPLGEHGRERLHAFHADPFRQLAEDLGKTGVLRGQPFGGSTDRGGEKQFAARRRPQPVCGRLQAALIGDLEVPDLFHSVAEEVDPQRMLLDGREDVEDATADRDVAALLDQIRARVTGLDKPGEQVIEVGLVARPQPDRLDFTEPGHDGLQEAAYRGDDDLERARGGPCFPGRCFPGCCFPGRCSMDGADPGAPACGARQAADPRCRNAARAVRAGASPRPGSTPPRSMAAMRSGRRSDPPPHGPWR